MATEQASEPPDRATRAFVDSYDSRSYADPWEAVLDYRRVQRYRAEHPDAGRHAVGTALDLPPSRVRGWLNGGRPDAVRGYEHARDRGWLPFEVDSAVGAGLTVLLAWVYAGGSIAAQHYVPYFAVGDTEERGLLERAGDAADADLQVAREEEAGRADEYRGPTVLGRALAALGAPAGEKHADAVVTLPAVVQNGPERTRERFVATYLMLRAQHETTGNKDRLRFREARSERYLRSLAALLGDVLDADVWQHGRNVVLSHPATEAARALPDPLD